MKYMPQSTFPKVIHKVASTLSNESLRVNPTRWQGFLVKGRPDATAYELINLAFSVGLEGNESLEYWQEQIQPNLPWADDHFAERVGGEPLNPGVEWRNWPWGRSANRFRSDDECFNHTYMERLWPKYARRTVGGKLPREDAHGRKVPQEHVDCRYGIAFEYGDLIDLVEHLAFEPDTRQAWIPLFFPEDTGYGDGGRKPCTLGYQFICRSDRLGIWYPLRSCDFAHHFRDDCYLAVRLLLWVLQECRKRNPEYWDGVVPGSYDMHVTSLHIFENDWRELCRQYSS